MHLNNHHAASRHKGQQLINTQGMAVNIPLQNINSRTNSSICKTSSTGEGSFEKKVSKTPKAPGSNARRIAHGTDAEFSSESSTADKAYSS